MIEAMFVILVVVAVYLIWWGKQPDEDYGTKIVHASEDFKKFVHELKSDRVGNDSDRVGTAKRMRKMDKTKK